MIGSRPNILAFAAALSLGGCTAAKATYHLVEAGQDTLLTEQTDAPELAVYEWTKAEQYRIKAREEWSHSDFGAAEDFARKASEWAAKADEVAKKAEKAKMAEDMPDLVPEEVERGGEQPEPGIQGGEKIDVDELNDDLDEEDQP